MAVKQPTTPPPTPNHVWDPSGYWRLRPGTSTPQPVLNQGGYTTSGQTVGGPGSGSMSITPGATSPGMLPAGAGGGSSMSTDPYGQAALGFLSDTVSGREAPFSPAAIDAMTTRMSDMNAAAEGARNTQTRQAVAGGGASMSDPSARAAQMESMARRQTDNAMGRNAIDMEASGQNFAARSGAANTLAQFSRADALRRGNYLEDLRQGAYDAQATAPQPYGSNVNNTSVSRVQGYSGFTGKKPLAFNP